MTCKWSEGRRWVMWGNLFFQAPSLQGHLMLLHPIEELHTSPWVLLAIPSFLVGYSDIQAWVPSWSCSLYPAHLVSSLFLTLSSSYPKMSVLSLPHWDLHQSWGRDAWGICSPWLQVGCRGSVFTQRGSMFQATVHSKNVWTPHPN